MDPLHSSSALNSLHSSSTLNWGQNDWNDSDIETSSDSDSSWAPAKALSKTIPRSSPKARSTFIPRNGKALSEPLSKAPNEIATYSDSDPEWDPDRTLSESASIEELNEISTHSDSDPEWDPDRTLSESENWIPSPKIFENFLKASRQLKSLATQKLEQVTDQNYIFLHLLEWSIESQQTVLKTLYSFDQQSSPLSEKSWVWINQNGQVVKTKEFTGNGKLTFDNGVSYEGEFSSGEIEGKGNFRSPEGITFEGSFRQGMLQGKGVFTSQSGVCVATFIDGLVSGKVVALVKKVRFEADFHLGQIRTSMTQFLPNGYQGTFEMPTTTSEVVVHYIFPPEIDGLRYEGSFKGFQGEGKITSKTGVTYKGNFNENGKLHGEGEVHYPAGHRFISITGSFKDGKVTYGTLTFSTGIIQIGSFDSKANLYGKGEMYFPNGHNAKKFVGVFQDGYFINGDLTLANGIIYRGSFGKDGYLQGKGEMFFPINHHYSKFVGFFQKDQFSDGTLTLSSGILCKGHFDKNGKLQGEGEIVFSENSHLKSFTGFFGREERGELIFKNDHKFIGELKNWKFINGRLELPNGDFYDGIFSEYTLVTGVTKQTFPSGDVYEGAVTEKLRTGKGVYTGPGGLRLEGHFFRGSLLSGKKTIVFPNGDYYEHLLINGLVKDKKAFYHTGENVVGSVDFKETKQQKNNVEYVKKGVFLRDILIMGISTVIFANQSFYTGEFEGELPEGNGVYTRGEEQISGKFTAKLLSASAAASEDIVYQQPFGEVYFVLKFLSKKRFRVESLEEETSLETDRNKRPCETILLDD